MLERYRTVYQGGQAEIVEKKSRFIATVRHVEKEEEILAFLEEMRKKYWDARHNCYAYTIGLNRELTRCSDDGEPSQTAGRPMLDVVLGAQLYDTAVVVTRYFGGVLLGTGGLVRAYSTAVQAGLAASDVIERIHGISLRVNMDYTDYGKVQYLANQKGFTVWKTDFADSVTMQLLLPASQEGSARSAITESTNARAEMVKEKELYFANHDGEVLTFDR
ncbi:MAG: YigZ family protein [Blautia sp.]|nr:YigZ family protein [Blautia sp.]